MRKCTFDQSHKLIIMLNFAAALLACVCCSLRADEVSFFVPENHPKYAKLDSMYARMIALGDEVAALEIKFITDPAVAAAGYGMKSQYCEKAIQTKPKKKDLALKYCRLTRRYLELEMYYFRELMPTQEGDSRARCFSLYRKARDDYAAMNDVAVRYLEPEQL